MREESISNELVESRRVEMRSALKWALVLAVGFVLVTADILNKGLLWRIDKYFAELNRPEYPTIVNFLILRIDDLGLRWITVSVLLVTALLISRRFNSWRPLNLAILSMVFLHLFVGATKIGFGRCKPGENFEICMFSGGMAYPSGHISNALVTWGLLAYIIFRYTQRAPFEGLRLYWLAALITISVGLASLLRNTHWVSDLLGGLFLGGAILVLVVAVDRFIPSKRQPS
jgi:membrane-associated phospholipid phosphatase